jgi:hypothetical protein
MLLNFRKRQLRQTSTRKKRIVRHIRERKLRLRENVQLFVTVETHFGQHQPKQVPKKHINRKLPPVKLKVVTVLPYFVAVENRKRLRLQRVEIGVGNDRARKVFRMFVRGSRTLRKRRRVPVR